MSGLSSSEADRPNKHKPLVAVLDVLPPGSRRLIEERFATDFDVRFAEDPVQRLELVRAATVLLAGWDAVDSGIIEATSSCRVIQKLGVGTDRIDVRAAELRRIPVLRAAGVNAIPVAEMTVLLALAVLRRLPWAVESVRTGRLAKEQLRTVTSQLAGKTVGLVGAGYVGRAAAKRFASFEVKLSYFDSRRLTVDLERELRLSYLPLDELVSFADVLSLHLPLNAETDRIVDARLLARMKPGAILVNTARGGLVDELALISALENGSLAGAGLDVTAQEPLPLSSPLLTMENVVVTPHYAGSVADNFPRVVAHAYRNVTNVLAGLPVPPEDVVSWPA
jgi:phosphoglycerate dehydrogenase-like enzyme